MQLSIRHRVNLLVGLAMVSLVVVAGVARESVSSIAGANARLVSSSERVVSHMTLDMMHDAIRGDVMAALLAESKEEVDKVLVDLDGHAKTLEISLKKTLEGASSGTAQQYVEAAKRIAGLARTDGTRARTEMASFEAVFEKLEGELSSLTKNLQTEATTAETQGVAKAMSYLGIAAIGTGLVLLVLGVWIGRSISRRVGRVVDVLSVVAERDFSVRIPIDQQDEIGRMSTSINTAIEAVDVAFGELREIAMETAHAATELARSSEAISSGAQEQAAAVEETAASLHEIAATVRESAGNAKQASQLAIGSRTTAERGGHVVTDAQRAMTDVTEASRKIGEIIGTIDEIAMQTNLLALNAAVEAARAGEHGRGFAVVASGVRDLAGQTAAAAKQVKALVETTMQRITASSHLIDDSGIALREIIASVVQVTEFVGQIAKAAAEQSTGVSQVSDAVAQMDTLTQTNSANTSSLSEMADQLAHQSSRMDAMLGQFKLTSVARTESKPTARPLATGSSENLDRFVPPRAAASRRTVAVF